MSKNGVPSKTRQKIQSIHALMQSTADLVRQELPKVYKKELMELLFDQPYTKIKFLERAGLVRNRQAASDALRALAGLGVLNGVKVGREWYFLNPRFLELLSQ